MKIRLADIKSHKKLINDVVRLGKKIGPQNVEIEDELFFKLLEKHQPTLNERTVHYIGSRLRIAKRLISGGKIKVSKTTQKERVKICESCIFHSNGKCLHNDCGCNIPAKSILETEQCPIRKW